MHIPGIPIYKDSVPNKKDLLVLHSLHLAFDICQSQYTVKHTHSHVYTWLKHTFFIILQALLLCTSMCIALAFIGIRFTEYANSLAMLISVAWTWTPLTYYILQVVHDIIKIIWLSSVSFHNLVLWTTPQCIASNEYQQTFPIHMLTMNRKWLHVILREASGLVMFVK